MKVIHLALGVTGVTNRRRRMALHCVMSFEPVPIIHCVRSFAPGGRVLLIVIPPFSSIVSPGPVTARSFRRALHRTRRVGGRREPCESIGRLPPSGLRPLSCSSCFVLCSSYASLGLLVVNVLVSGDVRRSETSHNALGGWARSRTVLLCYPISRSNHCL